MAWNNGDVSTGSMALKAELNLDKQGVDFSVICMDNLDQALNLIVSSQSDLCSGGNTSNAVVGMDITWSGECVVRYNEVSWEMAKNSFFGNLNNLNNIPFRITDTFTEEVTEAFVTITSLDKTGQSAEVIKLSLEFKVFVGKPVVTPIVPAP